MQLSKLFLGTLFAAVTLSTSLRAAEIGFEEDFALAPDRSAPLKTLIPGTPEAYYYSCLHAQNTGQLDQADQIIAAWTKRHGRTEAVVEMENRQALLRYAKDPAKALDYITRHLNLQFNDQPATAARQQQLPTALDPNAISRTTLTQRAFNDNSQTLAGFESPALDWLITSKLTDPQLHELLTRLQRPDQPDLPKLIAHDLSTPYGGGFGSRPIDVRLLQSQLDELATLRPDLLNNQQFIFTSLARLWPGADADWQHDDKEHAAYLDRLWAFVSKLAPGQNSLKANILFQRLAFDRGQDTWDKDRFLAYLKLPRRVGYINPLYLQNNAELRNNQADLSANYQGPTQLPPINNDTPLVRSYLLHFLAAADSPDEFAPYVETSYLKQLFAEAKITNGIGDQEKWYAMLSPEQYQALKDRVDIDFAFSNKSQYAPDDKVSLDLFVKNVKTLIVKTYEINTPNYYRNNLREIDTDINLDGLVANQEKVVNYDDPPLRRVARHFDFPELSARGVYVIEFIGNGQSSRALVRKGKLRFTQRVGPAGHVFQILDEHNHQVPDAFLWLAGRQFKPAGDDHSITVPFSTAPQNTPIVLQVDDFASLDHFDHEAENYTFVAGLHVDRESLVKKNNAGKLIVRPALYLNNIPVNVQLLEEPRLTITSVDRDGVSTSREIPDFQLHQDQASAQRFAVPDRLASITFTLNAKIQNVSRNKKEDVSVSKTFTLNGIDATDKHQDAHLAHVDGLYSVSILGNNGEPRPDQPVQFSLKHRDFTQEIPATLKTDAQGTIKLGDLPGITRITATDPQGVTHTWTLEKDTATLIPALHAVVGTPVQIPYMGTAKEPSRDELSLLELRGLGDGNTFTADRFKAITLQDGFVTISDLPAGDYSFVYKPTQTEITLRITAGEDRDGWALGAHRLLQLGDTHPLQIVSVAATETSLKIQLANATPMSRVHLIATHFTQEYSLYADLGVVGWPTPEALTLPTLESLYLSGRNLGDEYRYIIDRKYAAKFPGNMLTRPGLLLNPWSVRKTQTSKEQLEKGGQFYGMAAKPESSRRAAEAPSSPPASAGESTFFSNLDFLADRPIVMHNLQPDKNGLIELPRKEFGTRQDIHILAVDPASTVYREISLPTGPLPVRDLRLAAALDPAKHAIEQKQITLVRKDEKLTIGDSNPGAVEFYASLAKAYKLYSTLHPDPTLAEFSFITQWNTFDPAKKQELYSKYTCHELNYFLYRKDPDFFKLVVLPYLKNKKDKTFMDHYLLGDDLAGYQKAWAYDQLNTVEKLLLADRIPAEQPRTARYVRDQYELQPPDVSRWTMLFDTGIKGSALDQDRGGIAPTAAGAPAPAEVVANGATLSISGAIAGERQEEAKAMNAPQGRFAARTRTVEKAEAMDYLSADKRQVELRKQLKSFYQPLDKTEEYAENNYYHLTIDAQNPALVPVQGFWNDYAAADHKLPFLSDHLAEPAGNFTQIMFALATLDLPFEPGRTTMDAQRDGKSLFTATAPTIVFHKEIREVPTGDKTPILISQNYFRNDDRYTFDGNEKSDKFVTDEFLTHTVYGCQVVVTNPTSTPQKLDLLLQIPQGALPVLADHYTTGMHIELAPYQTQPIEYHFYFPAPGQFPHYPVQVAKNEKVIGSAPATTLKAVDTLTKIDATSWDYISQNGTLQQTIDFLKNNNVDRLNLDLVAWRMVDADSFKQLLAVLEDRHAYNHHLWSYALKHNDLPALREYLQHDDNFATQCGAFIDTPPLTINPVSRKAYQHLEYSPLVNARAHRLGRQRQILNDRFYQQYEAWLRVIRYRPALDNDDLMTATYYLLLQDRIDEARAFFTRVDPKQLPTTLQYDYFAAYLDFFTPTHALARGIAEKYANYPIERWRNLFTLVTAQLDEIDGKPGKLIDPKDRNQQMASLAAAEPVFDFTVESRKINLTYQNLPELRINYYLMDIELMFSQNPFIQEFGGQFSSIKPNDSATVHLDPAKPALTIDLPEKFHNSNVMVEITAGGKTKSKAYYANSLSVALDENYGQLRVTADNNAPLPTVYVKVYARTKDNQTIFYKDGYTDLRGKFDYTSLNTTDLDNVEKFSLLILSDTHGAIVKEAAPPKR
jgi:hypothetical protein